MSNLINNTPIVAIDFDGTIVKHSKQFPIIGELIEGAVYAISNFKLYNIKTILWTSRTGYELIDAVEFCSAHRIFFDAINSNIPNIPSNRGVPKVVAQFYIDDKSASRSSIGDLTNEEWLNIERYIVTDFKRRELI